ncbi:Ras-related protein Rap-2a [Sciurus carolinensis]|uniref:Ras-related protein Rap-2a n=1 Tax=Sciurus carolinensis TaxID=30640 RepID=A0AA41MFR0_SCICA|nr:Ras-related protein Rap-2a [Sciurus carolinensis]
MPGAAALSVADPPPGPGVRRGREVGAAAEGCGAAAGQGPGRSLAGRGLCRGRRRRQLRRDDARVQSGVPSSGGADKSALTLQLVSGTFIEKYDPRIHRGLLPQGDRGGLVALRAGAPGHRAGTELFAFMWDVYIQNGQGFILVYGLVNQQSFQDIKPMRDQITRVKRYEKVPVILVGNKVDLESEREVSSNEGRALAEEWGCPFMETSAKSKTMVDELFAEIVRQMSYAAQPDEDDPCCSACHIQ